MKTPHNRYVVTRLHLVVDVHLEHVHGEAKPTCQSPTPTPLVHAIHRVPTLLIVHHVVDLLHDVGRIPLYLLQRLPTRTRRVEALLMLRALSDDGFQLLKEMGVLLLQVLCMTREQRKDSLVVSMLFRILLLPTCEALEADVHLRLQELFHLRILLNRTVQLHNLHDFTCPRQLAQGFQLLVEGFDGYAIHTRVNTSQCITRVVAVDRIEEFQSMFIILKQVKDVLLEFGIVDDHRVGIAACSGQRSHIAKSWFCLEVIPLQIAYTVRV